MQSMKYWAKFHVIGTLCFHDVNNTNFQPLIDKIHNNGNSEYNISILRCEHSTKMNSRATHLTFASAHVALRMLLAFSKPVNCIFWLIRTLNWLATASKLHKHRGTCTTEWPYCPLALLWFRLF